MNNMKYIVVTAILALVFSSCEKWIDPDLNIDPDAPLTTSPEAMLPGIQASLAYYIGGFDVAGTPAIWMQQIQGQDRQASAIQSYSYRASDPNNLWNNMYTGPMMDLKQMITVCDAAETRSPVLGGISKVLMALALGNMSDLWGDIPNSEAFQGNAYSPILKPKMDSQQSIYNDIFRLLGEAIDDLQNDTVPKYSVNADYFYAGDEALWLKAAYHLRARYTMHLRKVDPSIDYNIIINDLSTYGFTSNSDDMEQFFDISLSGQNPLYQFLSQREGYVGDNSFYTGLFQRRDYANTKDPRDGFYSWDETGYWTRRFSPVALAQFTEAMFLLAEAYYLTGQEDGARYYLKAAIDASLEKYQVDLNEGTNSAWLTALRADIDTKTGEELLEFIMVEKYKHMFCQLESWTDWRRTGYPRLTPVQGTQIPRRYPYPQSERDFNEENTPIVQIFGRVWWDAI
jgi:hypothetical protein